MTVPRNRQPAGVAIGGQFAPHSTGEADFDLFEPPQETRYHPDPVRHSSLREAIEAESDEWTWTALAAEEGKERATELYQRSGGSLGRALALAQDDRNDPLKEVMGVPEVPLGWRVLADRVGGEPAAELYVRTGGSLQAALEAVLQGSACRPEEQQTEPADLIGTVVTSQRGLERVIAEGRQEISIERVTSK
jgi:hypothetical protein